MPALLQTLREGGAQHPQEIVNFLDGALVSASGIVDKDTNGFLIEQQASPNMTVKVNLGKAIAITTDKSMAYPIRLSSAVSSVTIDQNASGNPRIDAVVLYIDLAASPNADISNVAKLTKVNGTPAGSPTAPSDSDISTAIGASNPFIRLPNVTVASGATSIQTANIADTRTKFTLNDLNLPTAGNVTVDGVIPYRTIIIPAGAMNPTTTAGCANSATVESATNKINYKVLDYDTTTEEHAFCNFAMPASWDGGAIQFRVNWTGASGSGGVAFGLAGRSFGDDDAIDQALGTEVSVTDTLITAVDEHLTAWSTDVTLAGTPAGGEHVYLELARKVANAADTLGVDARVISLQLRYKTNKYGD